VAEHFVSLSLSLSSLFSLFLFPRSLLEPYCFIGLFLRSLRSHLSSTSSSHTSEMYSCIGHWLELNWNLTIELN